MQIIRAWLAGPVRDAAWIALGALLALVVILGALLALVVILGALLPVIAPQGTPVTPRSLVPPAASPGAVPAPPALGAAR